MFRLILLSFVLLFQEKQYFDRNENSHLFFMLVGAADSKASPFYQNLPDCRLAANKYIKKKSKSKALLCPMIR